MSRIPGRKSCLVLSVLVALLLSCGSFSIDTVYADSRQGKFHVVGVGPAGPQHATLKAIGTIKQADFIVCSRSVEKRFSKYLKEKTIMYNKPWKDMFRYKGKPWRQVVKSDPKLLKEFERRRIELRDELVTRIKDKIEQGRDVAILSSGDPSLFGPAYWYAEGFEKENLEIVPGVGAFSAAMAALETSSIPACDSRFVIKTAPAFLFGKAPISEQEEAGWILQNISRYQGTLAFYMALPRIHNLVRKLRKNYSPDLPMAVVYNAGYPEKEQIVKGSLDTILEKIREVEENWLGLVIVGPCLEQGDPYRDCLEGIANK